MALHGSDNRHLGVSPQGAVMKDGYSLNLGLDQVGIYSKDARKTTKKGLKALSTFAGIDKNEERLAILFGTKKDSGRQGTDKNPRSVDFTLSEVKKVGLANPKNAEQKFDSWRIGWDGINPETSLEFFKGQTLEFQMTVGGVAATFFNSNDNYTVRSLVNVPNGEASFCEELGSPCEAVDCREHTIGLVKRLNNYLLPGGQKLSQFFDIYPIFDTPIANATAVEYKQWCLEYCGFGGTHELSNVSAQYPGYEVTRDTMTNKFVIFAPASYTPADFAQTNSSILKGCEDCPAGYDEIEGGFVYGVALEDDGVDLKATVQALPGAVALSAVKTGQDFGVGHYAVVLTAELTQAQEATFVTANPTSTIKFLGAKDAFCQGNAVIEDVAWVECGGCTASTAKYRLMVADDCNGSRLAEVQAAYPELTVTKVGGANCVSVFETTVETDLSCSEGCNPAIVQQVFSSEAPRMFGLNNYWYPVAGAAGTPAPKCGFEITGKPVIMNPGECLIEELPFIATSSKIISLSGGYPIDYSMNTMVPSEGQWNLLPLSRAQDLDNLGGNLREWEQKGRFYFENEKPYRSVMERELTGSQSRLSGLTQYSDLFVTIEKSNKAGINSKEYTYITYHILVPFGKTTDLEEVFRSLAGSAGLNFQVK